jgi:Tol biopolymer transport system component
LTFINKGSSNRSSSRHFDNNTVSNKKLTTADGHNLLLFGRVSSISFLILSSVLIASLSLSFLTLSHSSEQKLQQPFEAFATFPGKNGKITFTFNLDVWVTNSNGSGQTRLTDSGRDFTPDWSPDATKIAFSRLELDSNKFDIYVMNSDGSGLTELTNNPNSDYAPSWSPDGSKIAFASDGSLNSDTYQIWVMNSDGSGATQLTDGDDSYPDWSPDGSKIAFSRQGGNSSGIWVMNSDGSGATQLTDGDDSYPDWSPDGSKIAFSRQGAEPPGSQIWVMNSDGSGATQLAGVRTSDSYYQSYPSWSPDGTQIAFIGSEVLNNPNYGEIWVMNSDGNQATQVIYNGSLSADWGTLNDEEEAIAVPPTRTTQNAEIDDRDRDRNAQANNATESHRHSSNTTSISAGNESSTTIRDNRTIQ